ncbi:MAG: hypothetical protein KY397_01410, partial [Gemmatimonadetes bacterium]|nr:hypothetical protein [Gemmatimonadota bacterium]
NAKVNIIRGTAAQSYTVPKLDGEPGADAGAEADAEADADADAGAEAASPADVAANEAAEAWRYAMTNVDGPTAVVCTRQKVPTLDRSEMADRKAVRRGGYVLADAEGGEPDVIVIATGSEVWKAVEARDTLAGEGIAARVVSMPSWEVFEAQDEAYRDEVLPPAVTARVSIEAGATFGWERWIGDRGIAIGVHEFGHSAPGETNMKKYGITPRAVVEAARRLVGARAPAG